MRDTLINATDAAVRAVREARFFRTERGFHGRFYCALQLELDRAGLIPDGAVLEMEYQKGTRHGTGQRPDIIFHIPTEHSGGAVVENNFAVWALKRRATIEDARDDFSKLDGMFEMLNYPLGFFVNIDAGDAMRQHYTGVHGERLLAVATRMNGTDQAVVWAQ